MSKTDDCERAESEVETVTPLMNERDEDWVVHANRTHYIAGQFRDLGVLCFMLLCSVLCLVFYMVCPKCLFGVLLLSACLCPFFHPMNAPLWLAIVLLTLSGWRFTFGSLAVTWNNGLSK
jgi:hypothetical protein